MRSAAASRLFSSTRAIWTCPSCRLARLSSIRTRNYSDRRREDPDPFAHITGASTRPPGRSPLDPHGALERFRAAPTTVDGRPYPPTDDTVVPPIDPSTVNRPVTPDASSSFLRPPHAPLPEVHILGPGALGLLVGFSLRTLPDPPKVTYLTHQLRITRLFHEQGRMVTVKRNKLRQTVGGFEMECTKDSRNPLEKYYSAGTADGEGMIRHLIVTTREHQTVNAVRNIKGRLGRQSEVLLVGNGMPVLEELLEEVWEGNKDAAPRFSLGMTTLGVLPDPADPFRAVVSGYGNLQIAEVPRETPNMNTREEPESSYLATLLSSTSDLDVLTQPYPTLLISHLESLAIRSVLGPLSTIFKQPNGRVLSTESSVRTAKLLLHETAHIIRSLPELKGLASKREIFSPERLFTLLDAHCAKTHKRYSYLYHDVHQRGRCVEVDYANAWLVKRAVEMDVPCSLNYMVTEMIRGYTIFRRWELEDEVVFEEGLRRWEMQRELEEEEGDAEEYVGDESGEAEKEEAKR